MPGERSNVLQIILHDLGTHLGCYGADVASPAIDELAAQGVRLTEHFCSAPQCSPSRGSIVTGRYPHATGLMGLAHRGWSLGSSERTLPHLFREAGYATGLFGIQHEYPRVEQHGYEFHDPCAGGSASAVSEALARWLEREPSEPFYASAGFFETHIDFAVAANPRERLRRTEIPAWLPDHPSVRQDLAELSHSVAAADRAVARILHALEVSGLAERTLVLFTTDHGLPLARAKATLYDPGLRTALLMRLPGRLTANRAISELASNVDDAPTVLDLCGLEIPSAMHGRSLAGLLLGGAYEPRREVFAELTYHETYNPMRAIRTHRHKLIRNVEPRPRTAMPLDYWRRCASAEALAPWLSATPPEWELYDLAADPWEMHNLAERPSHTALREELAARLERWMSETGDPLLAGSVAKTAEAERLDRTHPI